MKLTPTEEKIHMIIVEHALPNRDIAILLGCKERTVETHVRNILAKTGLRNREQLILEYYKNLNICCKLRKTCHNPRYCHTG